MNSTYEYIDSICTVIITLITCLGAYYGIDFKLKKLRNLLDTKIIIVKNENLSEDLWYLNLQFKNVRNPIESIKFSISSTFKMNKIWTNDDNGSRKLQFLNSNTFLLKNVLSDNYILFCFLLEKSKSEALISSLAKSKKIDNIILYDTGDVKLKQNIFSYSSIPLCSTKK